MRSATVGTDHPLRRNSAVSMAGLIVLGGTRVVYGSLVSRSAGAEEYGLVVVLIAATMILSLLLPGGLGSAISHYVPFARGRGDPGLVRSYYRRLSQLSVGAAAALGFVGAGATLLFGLPASHVAEVGLLTVVYCLYLTHKAGLYAFDRVGAYFRLEVVASIVTLVATVVVIVSRSNLYLLPLILGYVLFVLGAWLALRREARLDEAAVTRFDLRAVVSYAVLASVGSLASAGFLQLTQLLAAGQATLTAAAYFGASITLISPLYFLPRALSLALFPAMAQAHGAGDAAAVRKQADVATRGLFVLLAPVFVAGQLLAANLLTVYGGPPFAAGAAILQIMLLAAFLGVAQVASVNALSSSSGRGLRTSVGWAVAGAAVGVGVLAALWGRIGATDVALAYLAGTALTAAGPIIVVWRRYQMNWRGPVSRSLAAVVVAFLGARFLESSRPAGDEAWLLNLVAAAIGSAIALVALYPDVRRVLVAARGDGSDRHVGVVPIDAAPLAQPVGRARRQP